MRERGKPFVLYLGGALGFHIVPRGIWGWTQFVLWLTLLIPLCLWLEHHLDTHTKGPDLMAGVLLFVLGLVIWLVGGLWWMLARAEIVQMVEVRRKKQFERLERERERRRREQDGRRED